MSLYNMLMGRNRFAPLLMAMLDLDARKLPTLKGQPEDWSPADHSFPTDKEAEDWYAECVSSKCWSTGRFRDIYLSNDGKKIVLFTRNGGGNRSSYNYVFEILKRHPNYVTDYDDDFDSTYASIEFSVPQKFIENGFVEMLMAYGAGQPETPMLRFKKLIEKIGSGKADDDPDVKRALDVTAKLMEDFQKILDAQKQV